MNSNEFFVFCFLFFLLHTISSLLNIVTCRDVLDNPRTGNEYDPYVHARRHEPSYWFRAMMSKPGILPHRY